MQIPFLSAVKNNRNFVRYVIIGFSGVVLDFLSFIALTKILGTDPILANIISTSLGITNNFILNALYNFKKRDSLLVRFLIFYSVGIAGLLLSTIILRVLYDGLGVDPVLAKIVSLVFVLITQYTLNKQVTFSDNISTKKLLETIKKYKVEVSLAAGAAVLFAASLPYIFSNDEAFYLLNGKQIFHGLIPYADYFNHHMPGMDFLSAFLYIFSGDNLLLFRVIFNILIFGLLLINTALIYKAFNPLAARLYLVLMALFHMVWLHVAVDTSLIAYLIPLGFLLMYSARGAITNMRLGLISIVLFMIPFLNLAYSLVAFVLYLVLLAEYILPQRKLKSPALLKILGILALPYVLFLFWLLATGTLRDFIFDNWTFNQTYYAALIHDHIYGSVGLMPRLVGDSLNQIAIIIQNFSGNLIVQALLLLSYPAAAYMFWKSNKKYLAIGILVILLVINPRNNLYAPAGILSSLADTVNYSSIYKAFGLFLAAVSIPWYVGRYAQKDKTIAAGIGKTFAVVFLIFVPLLLAQFYVGTLQRVALDGQGVNFITYATQSPQEKAGKLNSVLGATDYYWSGPVDFDVQIYTDAKRAGTYNLWLPWVDKCTECRAELLDELKTTQPKIIVFRPFALGGQEYDYSAEFKDFISKNYTSVKSAGWEDHYILNGWAGEFKAKTGIDVK